QNGPWYERLGERLREPSELLSDELEAAARRNRPTILRYLLSLGLDATRPIGGSQLPLARIAAAEGHDAILDVLAEHDINVDPTPVEKALRFVRTDDIRALEGLLRDHPELLGELRRDHPSLCGSINSGSENMLARLIQLGFDINDRSTTKTPLHRAAESGDTDQARLLITHGADPNLADTHIGTTPWGWANHNGHAETADYLHALTHRGDPLPEITITSPTGVTTLTTPELIDAHLGDIHDRNRPTLTNLRHDRTTTTIGLGHPDVSVVLYLDHDHVPWHALPEQPSPFTGDVTWASTTGERRFSPDIYLPVSQIDEIVAAFIADPGEQPPVVEGARGHLAAPSRRQSTTGGCSPGSAMKA
ncbi:MAG: Imm1 family immunity protein, partial [Actinomycetota bacterium]